MDTSRELRSMTMATFPCPPLPMIGADLYGEERIMNSHDLLSFLVNTAALRDVKTENELRISKQTALYESYFLALSSGVDTWTAMTTFTRSYMMTFTHAMHYIRFLPFDTASTTVRRQACSWLAAQHILIGDEASAEQFADLPYDLLFARCAKVGQKASSAVKEVKEEIGPDHCNNVQEAVKELSVEERLGDP